jgi:CBS domain-containing protein
MSSARDIMSGTAECAQTGDTLVEAARKMRDLDVGALPICGDDNRLKGMITDRDIVIDCVAEGSDPTTVTVEKALRTMIDHGVRRLPVIDGHDLIGMVSQADIAKNLPDDQVAQLVEAISAAPANN